MTDAHAELGERIIPEGVDVDFDTTDTYRFDLSTAEDKQRWIKTHAEVDDSVKALSKTPVKLERGSLTSCTHFSKLLNQEVSFKVFQPLVTQIGAVPQIYFLTGANRPLSPGTAEAVFKRAAFWGLAVVFDIEPLQSLPFQKEESEVQPDATTPGDHPGSGVTSANVFDRIIGYLKDELQVVVTANFPFRYDAVSLLGFDVGGCYVLTLGLMYPSVYRAVSAVSPKLTCDGDQGFDALKLAATSLESHAEASELVIDVAEEDEAGGNRVSAEASHFSKLCSNQGIDTRVYEHVGVNNELFLRNLVCRHIDHHARLMCPEKYSIRKEWKLSTE